LAPAERGLRRITRYSSGSTKNGASVVQVTEPTCSGKVREAAADALTRICAGYGQQAKIERTAAKAD
jgi:hypothetical protein